MKNVVKVMLAVALALCVCVTAWAEPEVSRRQYRKNLAYNKNALPAGWKYEAGYTVWRVSRNLAANRNTYKMYKRDRAWHIKMHRYYRPEELALSTLDWTAEEVALFLKEYEDYFKFHPAGIEQ
jgi:hypothetical protein